MNLTAVRSISALEVRRFLRDRVALFSVIGLPLILVFVIGSSFGSQPSALPVGVLDADATPTSTAFADDLAEASLETSDYTDEAELRRDIRLGFIGGGVLIEPGFEAALEAPTGQATVTIVLELTSSSGPAVAAAINSTAAEFALAPTAVRVTMAALGSNGEAIGDDEATRDAVTGIAEAVVADMPPITTEPMLTGDPDAGPDNGFTRAVTTQFVIFVFLNGMLAGQTMVQARQLGVTRRMLSTPTGVGPHILGVGAGRWMLGLLQAAILFACGALIFGAKVGDPVASTAIVLVWTALSATVGMMVGAVAKTADQVTAMAVPLGIGMGMLGGSMWPLSIVPEFMQTIGHLTPHAWANDAWIVVSEEGGGLADITTELGVLIAATVALAAIAVVLLRRSLSR